MTGNSNRNIACESAHISKCFSPSPFPWCEWILTQRKEYLSEVLVLDLMSEQQLFLLVSAVLLLLICTHLRTD